MSSDLAQSLKGLRVLDASRVLAGPYAGQILADLGAEVVKIEQPGSGDDTRAWGPPYLDDLSAYFMSCNRGKRSLTLDLKQAAGRELWLKLVERSDIVLENFRADSVHDLGMDAATMHQRNPQLIICSLSGFGRSGPDADRPGYDFVVQGMSGMMAATGPKEGPPSKFGVAIADITTGLYAAVAVLAALRGRAQSGHGYAIELALIDCAVASMANVGQSFLTTGKVPARQGNAHAQIVPYEAFATSNGWLVLAVGNDAQWRRFCKVAGHDDIAVDARFATNASRVRHREVLITQVGSWLKQRSTEQWIHDLTAAKVPCGPIWDLATLMHSDLAANRRFKIKAKRPDGSDVDLLRSPLVADPVEVRAPPSLGADNAQILGDWLGLDAQAVAKLAADGVI